MSAIRSAPRLSLCLPLLFLALALTFAPARAGETPAPPRGPLIEEFLPPTTMLFVRTADLAPFQGEIHETALDRVLRQREMTEFLEELSVRREAWIDAIVAETAADREIVQSILHGQLAFAFVGYDMETGIERFCFSVSFPAPPAWQAMTETLKELARQRLSAKIPGHEIVIDGVPVLNLPMPGVRRFPLYEENYFVLIDNLLIHSPDRSLIEEAIAIHNARGAKPSLAKTGLFRTVWAGSGAQASGGFVFVNTAVTVPLLRLFASPQTGELIDALGLGGVAGLGSSLSVAGEGLRHTIYLHAPGPRTGVLEVLSLAQGAEQAAATLPAGTESFFAARVDLAKLYRQAPVLVDAVNRVLGIWRPKQGGMGLTALAGQQQILGVPAEEVLRPLGDSIVLQAGPAGTAVRFTRADPAAFEAVIRKMEQSLGIPFTNLVEGQRVIRYFNQSGDPIPAAPSYVVVDAQTILVATHPQVLKAILRQKETKPVAETGDFRRAITGMPQGLGMLFYARAAGSYERVYNAGVLFLNVITAYPSLSADPGLLPPGNDLFQEFFGYAVGMKSNAEGLTFTAYSPLGVGGMLIHAIDHIVVGNPATMGFAAAGLMEWLRPAGATPAPAPPTP